MLGSNTMVPAAAQLCASSLLMMIVMIIIITTTAVVSVVSAAEQSSSPQIQYQYKFDADQVRLDNIGQPSAMPATHAAITPSYRSMSSHYIEMITSPMTQPGKGEIQYVGNETTIGGEKAIDFDAAIVANESEPWLIRNLPAQDGTYTYIRVSVTYQSYDVKFNIFNVPIVGSLSQQTGVVSSFVGFNTFIRNVTPYKHTLQVGQNRLQGFWAFETILSPPYSDFSSIVSGQSPAGATTVVNPIAGTSPIPPGSCLVTGELIPPLVVDSNLRNNDTHDVHIQLSFSVNKSFEWNDTTVANGQWDIDASAGKTTEKVADMGLRGLKAYVTMVPKAKKSGEGGSTTTTTASSSGGSTTTAATTAPPPPPPTTTTGVASSSSSSTSTTSTTTAQQTTTTTATNSSSGATGQQDHNDNKSPEETMPKAMMGIAAGSAVGGLILFLLVMVVVKKKCSSNDGVGYVDETDRPGYRRSVAAPSPKKGGEGAKNKNLHNIGEVMEMPLVQQGQPLYPERTGGLANTNLL